MNLQSANWKPNIKRYNTVSADIAIHTTNNTNNRLCKYIPIGIRFGNVLADVACACLLIPADEMATARTSKTSCGCCIQSDDDDDVRRRAAPAADMMPLIFSALSR